MRFASFFSGGFITAIVVNPPERKLAKRTSVRWVDGTNDSSTKRVMFQALFFFIISYRLGALKTLYFHYEKYKNKLKQFLKRIWQEIVKKK